jgi:peptidoglycan/xylan/chitin deacetylase (PgdA/CDA1 family)
MSAATRLAQRALKVASVAADAVIRTTPGVVVLAYHKVGAPIAGAVNLPVALFEDQMAWLASGAAGRVVTLEEAVAALSAADTPSSADGHGQDDLVVITFDDGTADFAAHAVPVLARHHLPVTLYLATDFVESGRSFWDDGTVLSWEAMREVVATGLVDVGSHTDTHVLLDRVDDATVARELDRSCQLIGDHLGLDARHFAFPKALPPSPGADLLVRERFASAAVAGGRPNPFGATDLWRLKRTPIVVGDGVDWFERKARGGLRLEGAFRDQLDQRRYRKATR